jgi:hypothetical protein
MLVGQLGQTIAAAASESYEVHEVRHLWERLHGLSGSMLEVLDRLQPGLKDLQKIDLEPVAGDLRGFFSMLDARLRNSRGMLGGGSARRPYRGDPAVVQCSRVRRVEPLSAGGCRGHAD